MRFLLLGLLTAAGFAQQTETKPLPQAMQDALHKITIEIKDGTVTMLRAQSVEKPAAVAQPAKTCAIPLVNVLRGATPSRMPVMTPHPDKFPMKEVQVPAPSCDDVKK